jgi:hypothetical protein
VLLLVIDFFSFFDHEREHEHEQEKQACMSATLIDYALCGGRRVD